jgi:YfiH family protein
MSERHTVGVIRPEWPSPPNVHAITTTRRGGVSAAPYDSFNLALHVGDEEACVLENRRRLNLEIALETRSAGHSSRELPEPVWLEQVHGTHVATLGEGFRTGPADASVAFRPGPVCAVLTADCLPVLFCDRSGTRVGIAHAGWRGLAAGVVESALAALGCAPADLIAWLGPAIGPEAFEVGDEVRARFLADDPGASVGFERNERGRWQADLYVLARRRLARAGVTSVHGGGASTYAEPRRFFSYRRDGQCGRMATLIWLAS